MKRILSVLVLFILYNCAPKMSESNSSVNSDTKTINYKQDLRTQENTVLAVLWQQMSSEYKALCYQSYNLARLQLDQYLANNTSNKPLAIITDIDETVLDNSPYSAKSIETDKGFDYDSWDEWGELESAEPLAGSVDFFNYAASKNVTVFYISNRKENQKDATISNLKKQGLPFSDAEHVLLQTTTSNKDKRRQSVLETHDVVLYIGDNLGDFNSVFDHKSTLKRHKITDSLKSKLGSSYIVLPNPMYGAWEYGLYNENPYGISEKEKDSLRKAKLKSY